MYDKIRTSTRRTVLETLATTTVVSGLAGCLGNSGVNEDGERQTDQSYVDSEPEYDGWLAEANGYNGTVDRRGQEEVVVTVGTGNRGMAFGPAAVAISPETVVQWEWTGNGGTHNVRHPNGLFESEYASSAGHVFRHTFSNLGIYNYVCEPHRSMGMRGAVAVKEPVGTE